MEYLFDSDGKKRPAELVECVGCDRGFLKAKRFLKNGSVHFCTRECRVEYVKKEKKDNLVSLRCSWCETEFERKSSYKRSKSGLYFCSRECKDEAQSIANGLNEMWPNHYGGSRCYRFLMKSEFCNGCVGCGELRRFLLVVHHKDGDRQNNKKENLEIVCHNCHVIRHLRDGNYVSSSLTPRHLLLDFAPIEFQKKVVTTFIDELCGGG